MTTPTGTSPGDARWHWRVWALAGPIILSNISTPLLGAVDTAVVGHLPDASLIGGVAVGGILFNFLYWGFGFLRMGTTGLIAQAFGAGLVEELTQRLLRALLLAVALGLVLIILQGPIGWFSFWLIEASPAVEGHAETYYVIRIWSAPAALLNYAVVGWLLGVQRAGTALVLQVFLNGLNILLDLWFVLGLGWGIAGVAWASLLAELSAAVLGLGLVARAGHFHHAAWNWPRLLARQAMLALFRINADILLRTLCIVAGFSYFTLQGAAFGDIILAGNAILLQIFTTVAYGLDGFAHAAEILVGNAFGARNRAALRRAVTVSSLWALALGLILTLVVILGGVPLIALFTTIEAVRAAAEAYLPWLVLLVPISVPAFQLDGIFIGATRTAQMRNAGIASLVVFLIACWVLIPWLANHGLWLAMLIFSLARAVGLGCYYPGLERAAEVGP